MVHYEVLGRGRPVLFLHGWVGSWRYWIPCMQAVSMGFRAYALDLWGFGETAKSAQHYALEQQTRLVDQFLEEMGIARIALVGHGLGGVIALQYALQHPDFVDRVMLIAHPLEESLFSPRLRSLGPTELSEWLVGRSPEMETARLDAPKADPQALQASFASLASLNLKQIWQTLRTPCLMVNGVADPAVAAPNLDLAADLPERIHAISFEQSGHFPMLEESNKFHRLLADFLALPSGESPRNLQLKEEWKRRVR